MVLQSESNISISRRAAVSVALAAGCTLFTSKAGFAEGIDSASASGEDFLSALPNDPTYEQYLEFAQEYLTEMPNPEGMTHDEPSSLSARYSSPYWSSAGHGIKTFYSGDGNTFLQEAIRVIDVSTFQENIDWAKVHASGVDAAILRLGYGIGNEDDKFARNVTECRRLGIPFGVYLYSYAYDADFASQEAGFVGSVLKQYGLDRDMPVFYDLEKWSWTGHTPPTSPTVYEQIVRAFFTKLESMGYSNLHVYSYTSYLNSALNCEYIHDRASWAAQYFSRLEYQITAASGVKGWQYSSSGSVPGIAGSVDMNAFSPMQYWLDRMGLFGFVDVNTTTPHYEAIGWLKEMGISTGWADGTYRPYTSIARCDMAAFLYRLAGSPSYDPSSSELQRFEDVDSSTPHYKEVLWLASTGVANGWADGTYRPYTSIARCDMAAFLKRFNEFAEVDV